MKIRSIVVPILMGTLGLAACGDGSVKSPTFTPILESLRIEAPEATGDTSAAPGQRFVLPLGASTPINAIGDFTTPPGSETPTVERVVGDAAFSDSPTGLVDVTGGRVTATQLGIATISASKDGVDSDNTLVFRIVGPILSDLAIDPPSATISQFQTQTFTATGAFTDSVMRPLDVMWTVSGPATLSNDSGASTTLRPDPGSAGQTVTLTATTTSPDANGVPRPFTETATITINDEMIAALTAVRPSNSTVSPSGTVDFTAFGTFTNGATTRPDQPILDGPNGFIEWTSSNQAQVPIDTATDNGIVSNATPGQSTVITATLKAGVTTPPGATRSASTNLTVTDARCTGPLLGPVVGGTAVTSVDINDTCIGCTVTNADNATDGDIDTFATIALTLGLLDTARATLNVDGTTILDDVRTGFVVAKPAGLLSVELLNSLTVSTRLNGAVVQEAGGSSATALNVTALGAISLSGQEAFLVSFIATQPFNGLALNFNGGVLSLLPTVNVFQACGTAVDSSVP